MNTQDIHELKTMVEKVVRPVHARLLRKNAMREDGLARLVSAYEERVAQGEEPSRAVEHCAELLGDPSEATARLQRSVAWSDWLASGCDRYLLDLATGQRHSGLFSFQGIGILMLLGMIFSYFMLIIVDLLLWLDGVDRFQGGLWAWFSKTAATPVAALGLFLVLCLFRCLADSFWHAFCRLPVPDWPRFALVVVVSMWFLPGLHFGLCYLKTGGNLATTFHDTMQLFPGCALSVPYSLFLFVKVGRRLVLGPVDEHWRKRLVLDFAEAIPLLLMVFVVASIISNNLGTGLANAGFLLLLTVFWLAPFAVAHSKPAFVRAFQTGVEWEKLALGKANNQ